MAKQIERFTIPDPHALFTSCESFRFATNLLKAQMDAGAMVYAFAYLANDAFICELLLKCIDAARSGTHIKGHKLSELLDALPPGDQAAVEHHWNAQSLGTPNHLPLRDLLKATSSLFEMARYWHDGRLTPSKWNLIYLVTALRNLVLEIRPDWIPKVDLAKPTSYRPQRPEQAVWAGSTLPAGFQMQLPRNRFRPNSQARQEPES